MGKDSAAGIELVLTVCIKGLRVTQFQFCVCMCCTCGRIDNKADFDVDMFARAACLWDLQHTAGVACITFLSACHCLYNVSG